eukprot:jgi/Phyca11/113252/e_gw1.23.348.1
MVDKGFTDISDPPNPTSNPSERPSVTDTFTLPPDEKAGTQPFRLLHRIAVFVVAVIYVQISLSSFSTALTILRGQISHDLPLEVYTSSLISEYVGSTTIASSPLVQDVLGGSTTPRNNSIYLETSSAQSVSGCSDVPNFNKAHASYNLSYVKDLELVTPVVDCTFELLLFGDRTVAKLYYLVRQKNDPTKQFQKGSAVLLLLAAVDDISASTLTHHIAIALNYPYVADPVFSYSELEGTDGDNYWLLHTLPDQRNLDPAKNVKMARRFGRYKSDLREWRWYGRAVLHDSWAWTHAIHGLFALNVIFNLSVLAFVIFRRLRKGHLWVGDAFATISNMLLYRGLIILICNHLNGYWTITKMCISIGDSITAQHAIYYKPELVHADLLSIYLNLASGLSYLARERIDPLVAFLSFELGWRYRLELANLFPSLRENIVDFAVADATLGLLDVSSGLARLSPMELLTAYPIVSDRKPVVFSVVVSIFSPIVGYKVGLQQNTLTSFEVATGAALTKRYGLIATIDAVYGNGFLVVNGKFLIGAQDLLPLIIMKVTRVRFTNIFVYEIIAKRAVKETAQLVYPTTISWSDLRHLDVTPLT